MSDTTDLQLDGIERVLVVTAHPDDCDFGAAGTIARFVAAGVEVSYCIATDGDAGGFDESVPRSEMPAIRRTEQTQAAAALGVKDLTFLGYPDGAVFPTLELRRDISRVIRQKRPHRVLCQSAEIDYARIQASHPDHRAVGEAALCAVYPDARNPFAHAELLKTEGLRDWKVASTWVMSAKGATHGVDITDVLDTKFAALRCHASQFENFDDVEPRIRAWALGNGERFGLAAGRSAEAFLTLDTA